MDEYKYVSKMTIKKAVEAAIKDSERSLTHLNNVIRLVDMLDEKKTPHKQAILNDPDKPGYVYEIERWLIEDRKLKNFSDFDIWLKNVKPKIVIESCYNATYRRHDILTIIDAAKGCLIPTIEVKEDG